MWERACSRKGLHIRHLCRLTLRIREQARSHKGFGVCTGIKKGPHPAKETAPEIVNLLTRGNHRQPGNPCRSMDAPDPRHFVLRVKVLAQKGFGSMNLEIDGPLTQPFWAISLRAPIGGVNHWASRLFLKVIFKLIFRPK